MFHRTDPQRYPASLPGHSGWHPGRRRGCCCPWRRPSLLSAPDRLRRLHFSPTSDATAHCPHQRVGHQPVPWRGTPTPRSGHTHLTGHPHSRQPDHHAPQTQAS